MVTANDFPGIYPGAIRGVVTLDTEKGPLTEEVNATLVIRDILHTVEVSPTVATMAKGQRLAFRAVAYDKNDVVLSDVSFRWSVTDGSAGTIDASGVFIAQGSPGEYPGAVRVQAVQRSRSP